MADELGVTAKTSEHRKLTEDDMIFGIGRPATNEELREYLSRPDDGIRVSIEELRVRYFE